MKSNYVVAPLLLALSLVCLGQSEPALCAAPSLPQSPTAVPLSVDEAVAEALQSNPEIRASVRRLSLAHSKTTTARSLDDPMFMVRDWQTPLRKPWDLNQAQMMFSVQQTFQSKEKRDVRLNVAGDDVEAASSDLESMRQEVAAEVRKACADLMRNADERKLLDRQNALLKEALSVTMVQYTTGKVPQADVLRAQMALTRLDEQLIELDEERDTVRAGLNTLWAGGRMRNWRLPAIMRPLVICHPSRNWSGWPFCIVPSSRDCARRLRSRKTKGRPRD